MHSHLLHLHAIDLKVQSMCALVCWVLSFSSLKKKLDEQKNALMLLLDHLHVTTVIVLTSSCYSFKQVEKFVSLLNTVLPTLFLQIIFDFISVNPKYI